VGTFAAYHLGKDSEDDKEKGGTKTVNKGVCFQWQKGTIL
jgi:hypothetical protein